MPYLHCPSEGATLKDLGYPTALVENTSIIKDFQCCTTESNCSEIASYSVSVVPEPGVALSLCLGILLTFGLKRLARRSSSCAPGATSP
jgi:hypothetical protein